MVNYREINAENFPASEWVSSSGVLTTTPLPYCDECEQGWISVEGEPGQARIAKRCPTCHPLRQKLKYLERARLPFVAHKHLLRDYEWDSPEQAERVGAVLDWLHGRTDPIDQPCVMMYGPPGNGKSFMLHVLGKHACFNGKRALFLTHEGYMLDLRASFSRDRRIDFHELLERVDLLCLDELGGMGGGGHWSAWYKAQVLEMISAMYDRWAAKKLSIVMTSNLVPKQILDDLCERNTAAESRLAQMFGKPVRMIGPDRRASSSGNGWR